MLEKIYKNRSPHKRKPILDACCGSRAMWFDRTNPLVDFMDIRSVEYELSTGQLLTVNPDIVGDFTNMPFRDESYKLVVWDPPHLLRAGKNWDITKKYGLLNNWEETLRKGFKECMRVLDDYGVLIFKWGGTDIKAKTVIKAIGKEPLFGQRIIKNTIWFCYMKIPE